MLNRFLRWLVPKLENWCIAKGKVFNITGKQGPDDVYLIRYFLFQSKYLSVYIHRFLRSDIDDPHDHPFHFLGYVVQGGYDEILYTKYASNRGDLLLKGTKQPRMVGKWGWRYAKTTIHKVEVDRPRTVAEKDDAPLTFIIRGPYIKDWYFYKVLGTLKTPFGNYDKVEKIIWHKYLGVVPHSRE